MSRLRQEVAIIPRLGYALAIGIAVMILLGATIAFFDEPGHIEILIGGAFVALLLCVFILLISYVYADARRRGMRHVLWTLLVIFVPQAIGFIIYFVMRDPLLQPCRSCGTPARREYAFCPQCGSTLPRVCPSCSKPVDNDWPHCAHCGVKLGDATREDLPSDVGAEPLASSPEG